MGEQQRPDGGWPETTVGLFFRQNWTGAGGTTHWGLQSLGRKSKLPGMALGLATDMVLHPFTHIPLAYHPRPA